MACPAAPARPRGLCATRPPSPRAAPAVPWPAALAAAAACGPSSAAAATRVACAARCGAAQGRRCRVEHVAQLHEEDALSSPLSADSAIARARRPRSARNRGTNPVREKTTEVDSGKCNAAQCCTYVAAAWQRAKAHSHGQWVTDVPTVVQSLLVAAGCRPAIADRGSSFFELWGDDVSIEGSRMVTNG